MPMKKPWKGRHLVHLLDYRSHEIHEILELGSKLKAQQKRGEEHRYLSGKTLAMIFEKPSTRTRLSFEVGMEQLGGKAIFLSARDLQIGRGEPVKDTARVLSRYVDGIMIRAYYQKEVEELAHYASVPVINGLTDRFHPCQALADLLTVHEQFDGLGGHIKIAYLGDGNNVAHSLMIAGSKTGVKVHVAHPPGYAPEEEIVSRSCEEALLTGAEIKVTEDPVEAVKDAHVLYTDVWASMGQEEEQEERLNVFQNYRLERQMAEQAHPEAVVMHCLPAHRGEEITDEVIEAANSVVFDQAENRLHAQKALMTLLIEGTQRD